MSKAVTITARMGEFKKAFTAGINGIVKAGEIYVKALDDDPRNADKFKAHFAELVPDSAWSNFEAIGRKWMHPRLLMGGVADRRKNAAIKRLPYSAQERVFNRELIPVVINGRTKEIDLLSAPADVVEAVCDTTGFRNVKSQKDYIKSANQPKPPVKRLPYLITNGKVYFSASVLMSKDELLKIVGEM